MTGIMSGVRVVEVASWTFVPAAGAVLAEWGADVIKVEHPVTGDPQRGLSAMGLVPQGPGGGDYMLELPNRGKKSVGIELTTAEGREALRKLVATADVLVTNYLPKPRKNVGDRRQRPGRRAVRDVADTTGRPRPDAEPDHEHVPHEGRALRHPDDAAVRPLLARLRDDDRPPGTGGRSQVQGRRRPLREPQGMHRHPRRHLRREDLRGVAQDPRQRQGRVGAGADAGRAARGRAAAGQRLRPD